MERFSASGVTWVFSYRECCVARRIKRNNEKIWEIIASLYPISSCTTYIANMIISPSAALKVGVGWGLGKKRLSIDSGILWGHADMYKSLLGQKNWGTYFIKLRPLWPQRPVHKVLRYWKTFDPLHALSYSYVVYTWLWDKAVPSYRRKGEAKCEELNFVRQAYKKLTDTYLY